MGVPQVLYEAKLAQKRRELTFVILPLLALWTIGWIYKFKFDSSPDRFQDLAFLAVGATVLGIHPLWMTRFWKNCGCYRISIDDYGLYVHSDDPTSPPSFSVIATDMGRLVRKTVKHFDESDDHEYFVETKSGTRHQFWPLFAGIELEMMELFDRITDRFPWVEIVEEVQPPAEAA